LARLKQFIHEIHRRSLWQVLGIYVVGSWVAIQVVQTLTESLGMPLWFPQLAVVLLIVGFPIVMATAFVQEGIRSSPTVEDPPRADTAGRADATARQTRAHRLFTWRNATVGGVAAFALWGVVAALWILSGGRVTTPVASEVGVEDGFARAIAVLPFDNLSTSEENAYFADGIHEDVLTQLSRIADLTVISRTSVLTYRESDKTLREIGGELGVGSVLEGSVRRLGDNVRITVQLVDAVTDQHLWADQYDRTLTTTDVFAIQTEIAREIVRALQATLSPDEASRIAHVPTESLRAYDLVLRGRAAYRRSTDADNTEAIRLFKAATALDPGFADAWAGLAAGYSRRVLLLGYDLAWTDSARAAASRAIEADPESARAYRALASAESARGRWQRSTELNLRAIELDPNYSVPISNTGAGMEVLGRYDEALRWYTKGARLNPSSSNSHLVVARMHALLGRFEDAEPWLQAAQRLDDTNVWVFVHYIWLDLMRGRLDQAERWVDHILAMHPGEFHALRAAALADVFAGRNALAVSRARESARLSPAQGLVWWHSGQTILGYALQQLGELGEAERQLDDHLAERLSSVESGDEWNFHHWEIATIHAIRGEADEAVAWAERAYDAGFRRARFVDHDPMWDSMRPDPRFQELLGRIHADLADQRRGVEARETAVPN
jgi:TolB-like protein